MNTTNRVTCPVCNRSVAMNAGRLAHHGHSVKRGLRGNTACEASGYASLRAALTAAQENAERRFQEAERALDGDDLDELGTPWEGSRPRVKAYRAAKRRMNVLDAKTV